MKLHSVNSLVFCLRVCIFALLLTLLSLGLFSFITVTRLGDEVWKQLGLNEQQANTGIYRSFTGGYLYHYDARNAKSLVGANRVEIAKEVLLYAKRYVNSEAFKKAYAAERLAARPTPPVAKPERTTQQIQKEEIAKLEKSVKEMEVSMKQFDAEMKKNMQPVLEMFKTNLKEYQNPGHPYFQSMAMGDKFENESAVKSYEDRLKKWQQEYPGDHQPIIRKRLLHFLNITDDVDYDAALKTVYQKQVFVNPAYERKSREWKQAFRAGKEVTTMARTFAKEWLAELN